VIDFPSTIVVYEVLRLEVHSNESHTLCLTPNSQELPLGESIDKAFDLIPIFTIKSDRTLSSMAPRNGVQA